jgi:hypothetical protein
VLATLTLPEYKQATQIIAELDDPYMQIIRDTSEVSVIVTADSWQKDFVPVFGERPMLAPLAKIFCDVDETCTGYLLTILDRLSPSNVGIYVQGAYVTDHVFVHSEDLAKAREIIQQLQISMQTKVKERQ